jgi:hypothetical protein
MSGSRRFGNRRETRHRLLARRPKHGCGEYFQSWIPTTCCVVFVFDSACAPIWFATDAYTRRSSLKRGRPAPSQKGRHEERPAQSWCVLLTPRESDEQQVVAADADRDPERRSFMVATRISRAGRRRTVGRSAAGVPRTYRIVRSSTWARRLAVLLRRLVP